MVAIIVAAFLVIAYLLVALPAALVLIAVGVGLMLTILLAPVGAVFIALGARLLFPLDSERGTSTIIFGATHR